MTWSDVALLFSQTHRDLIADTPIGLIDCGARGDIPEPWSTYAQQFPELMRVLGFEADATEAAHLNNRYGEQRRYLPAAAWNSVGTHALYITDPPQASSLFPPNTALTHLHARVGDMRQSLPAGRVVQRTIEVPTTTIDAAIAAYPLDADVLKIDTQGAEYEVLEGARAALRDSVFAVIAETWTTDVYQGVKPTWEVMRLMADMDFAFMTHDVAGYARRSFMDTKTFSYIQREQIISLELLFFRSTKAVVTTAAEPANVYKAVGIADVLGFPDYGVELLHMLLTRWPNELANVKYCYDEMTARRTKTGATLAALYPPLHS
ncbi:MAG: FkbM family methyltransferase [Rhodospirillaceae bacterium]|nr:FkbM family methyltransferase [Rhodospirillaceae bacterium]